VAECYGDEKVFISGPIQGMETQQGYRDIIADTCRKLGYEVIDPWLRKKSSTAKKSRAVE
jgi:hypothetical protein